MRIAARGFVFILVVAVLGGPAATAARAATALGGYRGLAAANGLHAYYEPKGILPIAPPVDFGSPDALATIASGPNTFARAGVADPGDLLANPDALFTLFSSSYPSGTLPPYPYRASASSSLGKPSDESNPAPGLNARAEATGAGSHARASMPGSVTPAIASIESSVSEAWTETDGATVTVRSLSRTEGFDLLGMLKIDSIVTELKATSMGSGTKLSGRTRVSGATFAGQPVTIDGSGIHMDDSDNDVSRTGDLNAALANAGMHVSVVEPTQSVGGTGGQRAANGVRIDFEFSPRTFPEVSALLDLVPPIENPAPGAPSVEDLIAVARARHLVAVSVGGAQVSLEARSAAVFPDLAIPSFDELLPSLEPSGSTSFLPEVAPARVGAGTLTAPRAAPVSTTNALPVGGSIAGLVLLALLVQPLLGARLSSAAAAVLAPDPSTCEEDPT
jgi:hypothetical protein